MRRVTAHGLRAVDGRSAAFREMKVWRDGIIAALAGEDNVTPQRRTILELAAVSKLLLNHIDSYLLQQPSLIHRRAKRLYPVVEQRMRIADALMRQLTTLGLDRVAAEAMTVIPTEWRETVASLHEDETKGSNDGNDSNEDAEPINQQRTDEDTDTEPDRTGE
jgi:hypothetical protein